MKAFILSKLQNLDGFFTRGGFKKYLPGMAWFFVILLLISLPGRELPKGNTFLEVIMFDKWVHAGLFGALTYLIVRPLSLKKPFETNRVPLMITGILLSFYGLATELIQHHFIEGRTFDSWDWFADTIGVAFAFYLNKKVPQKG